MRAAALGIQPLQNTAVVSKEKKKWFNRAKLADNCSVMKEMDLLIHEEHCDLHIIFLLYFRENTINQQELVRAGAEKLVENELWIRINNELINSF